jgi:hypothetical protein
MLSLILLAFFLVEFLVIVGVLLFAILCSRPEVPLKGHGGLEWTGVDGRDECAFRQHEAEPTTRAEDASKDSRTLVNQLMAVRPLAFAAPSLPSGGGRYQSSVRMPSWSAND